MNWIDIALVAIWVTFIAIGARVGNLWTSGCLLGGFLGAFLADYYAIPLGNMLGSFSGAQLIAAILLFGAGVGTGVLVGAFLGKFSALYLPHIFDSLFGFMTGVVSGFLAVSLIVLWSMQFYSEMEQFKAWQTSRLAKPLHNRLEMHFEKHGFQSVSFTQAVRRGAKRRLEPLAVKATDKAKDLSGTVVEKLKKE